MKVKIAELDIIYLSYDEPNAEKNYADLLTKVPWAKRVHGVDGSDAAHKACAELSETDRFVTVDGDNTIRQDFINQVLDFDEHTDLANSVISWCGKNSINGLMYGNGGLKCWPKEYVLNMRTHENADANNLAAQVDFCWDIQYIQQNSCYSDVHNNETPQQAWRAGFREGVKLALDRGNKVSKEDFLLGHTKNLNMLYIWMMVGSDITNGNWAILGAREGLAMTMLTDWNYTDVKDFKKLNELWAGRDEMPADVLHDEIFNYGSDLINQLEIPIAVQPLNEEQSQFFKTVNENYGRKINNRVIDREN
ncbi:hypothetical protein OAG45_01085 [bacterium]|jgi:hypothetical protein|nr:hypothetical protein [bacterium]